MPWTRLDPTDIADALQVEIMSDGASNDDAAATAQVLANLREQLQTGAYVAVQDHEGRTFLGTPDEAAEHMMAS